MTPKSSLILDLLAAGIEALAACEKCQEAMAEAMGELPPLIESSGRQVTLPWSTYYGGFGAGDYGGTADFTGVPPAGVH